MLAVIIIATLVTAVIILALRKVKSERPKIEESAKWGSKWNEKWCTDECLYCEQNDWCKFSEVKKE